MAASPSRPNRDSGPDDSLIDLAYREPAVIAKLAERHLCERNLLYFFERAWREIDPAPLKVGWHHECEAKHLMAVARGEIRRIIFNVPPRTSKTILCNVCFPAWCWIQEDVGPLLGPQVKFMCISYGQTLSTEIATLARRLILSDWYQGHWGDRVKILEDQGRIDNFGNTAGGFRIATSMTGSTLGRGGDCRIIDDPQSIENANSQIETANVTRTYREALQTRETDPSTSAEVIIMQRLNEDDLTGYILKEAREEELVHVCLPMEHDPDRHCTTAWYDDPRAELGELLWPEQFPQAVVNSYRTRLGPYAFAGQYQQSPEPRGGGIFQRDWIEAWPPLDQEGHMPVGAMVQGRIVYPALEYVVAWVDTAFTEKQENDFSAMSVLGVFRAEGRGRIEKRADGQYVRVADDRGFSKVLLLYGWQKRLTMHGPPVEVPPGIDLKEWNGPRYREQRQADWGLCEWVADTCRRYKVDYLGIETQGAGHTLEQELRRLHSDGDWGVELVAAKGDKVARGYRVQHLFSSRQFYVPTYEDGTNPTWCAPIMDQLFVFPKGRHDDAVDTVTGALQHLREIGIFERRGEYEAAETVTQQYQRHAPPALPYDV